MLLFVKKKSNNSYFYTICSKFTHIYISKSIYEIRLRESYVSKSNGSCERGGGIIGQGGCCLICASHLSYVLIPDMSVFLPVFSVEGAIIIIEDNNIPIQAKN